MNSFALTDVGRKRALNQDTIFATDAPIGTLPNLYIVADGMGGENAGDYASARTVKQVVEEVANASDDRPVVILENAISKANSILHKESMNDPSKKGMGTTIVAASVLGDHLFVASVGDSRLYVSGVMKLTQITKDHSVVAELVRSGELKAEEARVDKRKNMITRAVGAEATVKVDYFDVILSGDEAILICSDGLTNMVDDDYIYDVLMTSGSAEDKSRQLVTKANENGGADNISAIVIQPFVEVK